MDEAGRSHHLSYQIDRHTQRRRSLQRQLRIVYVASQELDSTKKSREGDGEKRRK